MTLLDHDLNRLHRTSGDDIAGSESIISVRDVTRTFGHGEKTVGALAGIDLDVRRGEMVALLGTSGCGKSTLLAILAGLDRPTSGTAVVSGRIGLMFQEAALFPWLTVRGNIETALRLRGVTRRDRRARAEELIAAVHLDGFGERRPHELSGGMRQRAALARALAQDVDVLLMDEPFAALDASTRVLLHTELERQWEQRGLTIVFVTHDVREAVRLGDRVVLIGSRPGRVIAEFSVELERPRRVDDISVNLLADQIASQMQFTQQLATQRDADR